MGVQLYKSLQPQHQFRNTVTMIMGSLLCLSMVLLNSVAEAKHYLAETVDNNNNNNNLAETVDAQDMIRIPLTRGSRDYADYSMEGYHDCSCNCCSFDGIFSPCCLARCLCKNK